MKFIKAKIAVLAIISCVGGPVLAGESLPVRNCTWCHGPSAQGFFNAPRLAGQKELYIEAQLMNFRNHIRDDPNAKTYMWAAAANVGPGIAHDFAVYFASLPPKAAADGQRQLAEAGGKLFEYGDPAANVVQCIACHGPHGQGVRQIPQLGGLSYYYLKRRLEEWREGFHGSPGPMPQVVATLSSYDIDALASYLSFVEEASTE
jgi:cytochrome c553